MSDFPRRIQIDKFTPAEAAIHAAMQAVEAMPADPRLTDAVRLLGEARSSVADYVDGEPRKADDPVEVFLTDIRAELHRARAKFPSDRIMTIALAEEFGELCKAVLDESADRVRKEAVQTAVMAARLVLDGDGSVKEWREQRGLDPLIVLRHACCGQHPEDGHAPGCGT